ncbi:MAG: ATP-dependent RNA helicase HrpA, partial [Desulfobulbus sp.]
STEIKALKKECKAAVAGHTASWLSLGIKATAAEIRNQLTECILDIVFAVSEDLPDEHHFQQKVTELKKNGILRLAKIQLTEIMNLLATRKKVQLRLAQWKQRTAKNNSQDDSRFATFQQLLNELLPKDFLTTNNRTDFADVTRYMRALALRIERAEHSPAKDSQKEQRITPFLKTYQPDKQYLNSATDCCREVALYQTMIQEFRVSVFAPELGTAFPVSEKRLKKQWQIIENTCRTME